MMLDDLRTVMWKERKGLFRIQGRKGQTIVMMFTPLMLAIVLPLQQGKDWVTSGFSMMIAFVIPLLLVGTSIPASFASEREQHTLPTLLASRLSDRAILFGKLATSVAFGWLVTLVVLLIALVTVNVAYWEGSLLFYAPSVLVADLAVSLLVALLTAGAGILFSMRAESVMQAQQTLMSVLLVPPLILQVVFFVLMALPAGKEKLKVILDSITFESVAFGLGVVLAILAGALLLVAVKRFNRARLVLG